MYGRKGSDCKSWKLAVPNQLLVGQWQLCCKQLYELLLFPFTEPISNVHISSLIKNPPLGEYIFLCTNHLHAMGPQACLQNFSPIGPTCQTDGNMREQTKCKRKGCKNSVLSKIWIERQPYCVNVCIFTYTSSCMHAHTLPYIHWLMHTLLLCSSVLLFHSLSNFGIYVYWEYVCWEYIMGQVVSVFETSY